MFLQRCGVPPALAARIAKAYGSETEAVMRTNPYRIIDDVDKVGFLTADRKKEGLVLVDRIVYFCEDVHDLHALQWRLGGIDNILFPMDWEEGLEPEKEGRKEAPVAEQSRMTLLGYALKRGVDIALSGALLIIFSPVIGICALAIYLEDGKPVRYHYFGDEGSLTLRTRTAGKWSELLLTGDDFLRFG